MMKTILFSTQWNDSVIFNRIQNFSRISGAVNSRHVIPLFVTPILLEFLQLKYPGDQHKSPTKTHPVSVRIATASFFGYCLACDALLRLSSRRFSTTCINIIGFCTWVLGRLSLASLAAVLSPNSVTFVPYVLYFLLALAELLYCVVYYRSRGEQLRDWLLRARPVRQLLMLWRRVMHQGLGVVDEREMMLPVKVAARH